MSVINATPLLAAAGGDYQISRSVRLRSSASAYFNRTPASAGNRKTWTWSGWAKRGALGSSQTLFSCGTNTTRGRLGLGWMSTDQLNFDFAGVGNFNTTAIYRDPSAWYHIVFTVDSTQASNRGQIWVNNSQVYAANFCNQNEDLPINTAAQHMIGNLTNGSSYFDGYLTEVNFIDGQALTPSSFGETDSITGVWKPKKYAGTYGTNGFYLNFSDNSAATAAAIGKDYSGNGNNWTPNNISVTAGVTYDSMLDVPTLYADGGNGRGNYATLNPLFNTGALGFLFLSNGNLTANELSGNASWRTRWSTIGIASGKFYAEFTVSYSGATSLSGAAGAGIGLYDGGTATYVGQTSTTYGYLANGQKYNNGSGVSYGATYANGDVIGIAYDADAGTLTFFKNGVSQGVAYSGIPSGTYFLAVSAYWVSPDGTTNINANFGQRPFAYTPPTGFKALNTQNLPEPTIKKGNQYFDATTYTGNGSAQSVVNSGGMQPDLVWVKGRSTAYNHILANTVVGIANFLNSNTTNAESNTAGNITSVNADGFSVGSSLNVNQNAATQVAWQWKESPSAGFDIVTYTGNGSTQNIAHNLGVAPKMMIVKSRGSAQNWPVYHASLGKDKIIYLSLTNTPDTTANFWGSSGPTSSVFTVTSNNLVNTTSIGYVAYLFAEVAGFSRFGSYTGNGSADGPFVFCGFRPRFVMIKASTTAGGGWVMHDTSRSPGNLTDQRLAANTSGAEFGSDGFGIDVTSNGFKIRTSDGNWNASSIGYIFAAFAESPFKNSLAR